MSAIELAPRIAMASWPTTSLTASSASLTRTLVTAGKALRRSSRRIARSRRRVGAVREVTVARCVCGAPAKVLGENTMTKLMPSDRHSTWRRLAIVAVMLRPSTLTVIVSPTPRPRPSAIFCVERHQRLAAVVVRPPFALDDVRALRQVVGIGDAAVAVEHPGDLLGRLDLGDRHALQRHQAAAHHRHALDLALAAPALQERVEALGLGVRDVEEEEARRLLRQGLA